MVWKKFQRLLELVEPGSEPSDLKSHIGIRGVLCLYKDCSTTSDPGWRRR